MASEHVRPGESRFKNPRFEIAPLLARAAAAEFAADDAATLSEDNAERSRLRIEERNASAVRCALEDALLTHQPRTLRDALFQAAVVRDRLTCEIDGEEQMRCYRALATALDFIVTDIGFDAVAAGLGDYFLNPAAQEGGVA